ncbi:MAG: hypothetical protein IIC25_06295, partial [Chloroflexi bacterium]|nr:hypothetical protein [Chloroflexota bacterium]
MSAAIVPEAKVVRSRVYRPSTATALLAAARSLRAVACTASSAARFPLALITAKSSLRFINSSYANLPRHIKAEGEPYLDIHPNDADARGVSDGDSVRVYNDRGAVELRIRVGDRVRPDVVAMPFGRWASLSPNGYTANALTSDSLSDMGRGGNFYDTLVEVARV